MGPYLFEGLTQMPAQANVVLVSSTSANKTFVAAGVVNGIATFFEKSASVFSGYWRLTYSMKFPAAVAQPIRHMAKLVMPTTVTETINGVTYGKVTRQILGQIEVVDPQDSTIVERQDFMAFFQGICQFNGTNNLGNQVVNRDATT